MQFDMTVREKEILKLHEEEKLSFRAIGEKYGISSGRASQIFRDADRKRREAYRLEQQKEANKEEIPLSLTRGELIMLEEILQEYTRLCTAGVRHTLAELTRVKEDPSYREAERLAGYFDRLTGENG